MRKVSGSLVARYLDVDGSLRASGLSGLWIKELMESSNTVVRIRGGASDFEVGRDGGGVASEGVSGERGLGRPSGSEYGSRVN